VTTIPVDDEDSGATPTIKKTNRRGGLWVAQLCLVILCLPWSLPLMGRVLRGYKEGGEEED